MRSTGEVLADLTGVASVEVGSLSDEGLRSEILDLVRATNVVQAALWRRIGLFERRGLAVPDGFRSTRAWLMGFARFSPHAASGLCAKAVVLEQLSALTVAAQRGDVSTEQLAKVVALVDDVGIAAVQSVDAVLADMVGSVRPADVGAVCDRVRAHVDPDGAEPDPEAVLQRRGLTLARSGNMVRVRGQLDPESGAAVMTALDAVMAPPAAGDERTAAQRRADALTELARLPLSRDMLPIVGGSRPQVGLLVTPEALLRQARAGGGSGDEVAQWIARLAQERSEPGPETAPGTGNGACTGPAGAGADAGPGAGAAESAGADAGAAESAGADAGAGAVGQHDEDVGGHRDRDDRDGGRAGDDGDDADGDASGDGDGYGDAEDPLAAIGIAPAPQRGWLTWAGPISTATAQRIACDSVIYRVLYDPNTGQPLDVGRSYRTAPPWIRKALHARDRGCRWPGCLAPTAWCDAHHLDWWERDDGETQIDRLILTCRWHHTRVHEGGWSIVLDATTGEVHVTRPDGRPYELGPSKPWLGPSRAE